jgi:dihydrodipicolinate synthase/N-acetylneuraminate lyase
VQRPRRAALFASLGNMTVESVAVGEQSWVSGMSNVFARAGETLFCHMKQKRFEKAVMQRA